MPSVVPYGALAIYPAVDSRRWTIKPVAGPASYTQISAAAPPTGGMQVLASDVGLTSFHAAFVAVSDDGQYIAYPFPNAAQNAPQTALQFMVVTADGGVQVTGAVDLSGRTFLIVAFGD